MDSKRLTFSPIYGYKYADGDKSMWVIDDEAAAIVRRIYRLTIEGKGPQQIARILSDDKIERPTNYLASRGIVHYSKANPDTPYQWGMNAIARMIAKPEYAGHTVNFRSYKDSYKDKHAKDTPKEDWVIFENTHPAIVDQEAWETAQRCRKTVRRTDTHGEANPLTGLVFCADCGAKMYNHRKPMPTTYVNKKGYTCTRAPKDVYACSTYTLTNRRFGRKYTSHNIRTVVIRELALDAIKSVSCYAKTNEAEFVRQVREASAVRIEETAKAHKSVSPRSRNAVRS